MISVRCEYELYVSYEKQRKMSTDNENVVFYNYIDIGSFDFCPVLISI